MWADAIKTGAAIYRAMKYFIIRTKFRRYVAPHNVRRRFHNDSCNAHVRNMHPLLQWNNRIYNAHYVLKFHLEITKAKEMTTFYTYFPNNPRNLLRSIAI